MSSQRTKELRGAGKAHIHDFLEELSCRHNAVVQLVGMILAWIVDKACLDQGKRKSGVGGGGGKSGQGERLAERN